MVYSVHYRKPGLVVGTYDNQRDWYLHCVMSRVYHLNQEELSPSVTLLHYTIPGTAVGTIPGPHNDRSLWVCRWRHSHLQGRAAGTRGASMGACVPCLSGSHRISASHQGWMLVLTSGRNALFTFQIALPVSYLILPILESWFFLLTAHSVHRRGIFLFKVDSHSNSQNLMSCCRALETCANTAMKQVFKKSISPTII